MKKFNYLELIMSENGDFWLNSKKKKKKKKKKNLKILIYKIYGC